jgi:hypothetical protein
MNSVKIQILYMPASAFGTLPVLSVQAVAAWERDDWYEHHNPVHSNSQNHNTNPPLSSHHLSPIALIRLPSITNSLAIAAMPRSRPSTFVSCTLSMISNLLMVVYSKVCPRKRMRNDYFTRAPSDWHLDEYLKCSKGDRRPLKVLVDRWTSTLINMARCGPTCTDCDAECRERARALLGNSEHRVCHPQFPFDVRPVRLGTLDLYILREATFRARFVLSIFHCVCRCSTQIDGVQKKGSGDSSRVACRTRLQSSTRGAQPPAASLTTETST